MTRSRQRSDQTEKIARKLEIVLAELASLRILLAAHGISTLHLCMRTTSLFSDLQR